MAERQNRPQMPTPKTSAEEQVVLTPPPVHTDAEGPKVDLSLPVETETHKVKFQQGEGTKVEIGLPVSHQLEVIATRPGFIYNIRKSPGDRFMISDMSQLGDWMELADSKLEQERQNEIRLAKLKARQLPPR